MAARTETALVQQEIAGQRDGTSFVASQTAVLPPPAQREGAVSTRNPVGATSVVTVAAADTLAPSRPRPADLNGTSHGSEASLTAQPGMNRATKITNEASSGASGGGSGQDRPAGAGSGESTGAPGHDHKGAGTPPPPGESRADTAGEDDRETTIRTIVERDRAAFMSWLWDKQEEFFDEPTFDAPHEALRSLIPEQVLRLAADPTKVDIRIAPNEEGENSDNTLRLFVVERRTESLTDRTLLAETDEDVCPPGVDPMHFDNPDAVLDQGILDEHDFVFFKATLHKTGPIYDADIFVRLLTVHPELRRQGIATNLQENLQQFGRAQNFKYVVGYTVPLPGDTGVSNREIFSRIGAMGYEDLPENLKERFDERYVRRPEDRDWLSIFPLEEPGGENPGNPGNHRENHVNPGSGNPGNERPGGQGRPGEQARTVFEAGAPAGQLEEGQEAGEDTKPRFILRGNEVVIGDTRTNISAHEIRILRALMSQTGPMSAGDIAEAMQTPEEPAISSRPLGKYTSKLARFLADTLGSDVILIDSPSSKKLPTTYRLNPTFRYEELPEEAAAQDREVNPYRQRIADVPERFSEEREGVAATLTVRTDHRIINAQGEELRIAEGNPLFLFNILLNSTEPLTIDQIRTQGFETTDPNPARRCREAMRKLRGNTAEFVGDVEIIQRIETEEGVKFALNPDIRIVDQREEHDVDRRTAETRRSSARAAARKLARTAGITEQEALRRAARAAEVERRRLADEQRGDNPYYQKISDIPTSLTEINPDAYILELHDDHTLADAQGNALGLEGNSLYIVNALINSTGPQTIEDIMEHGFNTQAPDAARRCKEAMRDVRTRFFRFNEDIEIIQRIETPEGGIQYALNPAVRFIDRRAELAEQRREEEAHRPTPAAEEAVVYHSPEEIRAAQREFVSTTFNSIIAVGRSIEDEHPTLGSSLDRNVAEMLDKPLDIVREILAIDRAARALDLDLSPQRYPDIRDVDAYKREVFRQINKAINAADLSKTEKLLFGMHVGLPPTMNTYKEFTLTRRGTDDEVPYDRYYRWTLSQKDNHGRDFQSIKNLLFRKHSTAQVEAVFQRAARKVSENFYL